MLEATLRTEVDKNTDITWEQLEAKASSHRNGLVFFVSDNGCKRTSEVVWQYYLACVYQNVSLDYMPFLDSWQILLNFAL